MSEEEQKVTLRVEALRKAAQIITNDRNSQYGEPEDNFERIARIWTVIFGREVTTEDVAAAMIGLKLARYAAKSNYQPDTWIDIAGYAGCGYEVGAKLSSENKEF
jgi:hypothetical protein